MTDDSLSVPRRFCGVLSSGDLHCEVSFKFHVDNCGEMIFDFESIEYSTKSEFISDTFEGTGRPPQNFQLNAISDDGTNIKTNRLNLCSVGRHALEKNMIKLDIKVDCAEATITRKSFNRFTFPLIRMQLRGFKCPILLKKHCDIGDVAAVESSHTEDPDKISGYLAIQAYVQPNNISEWFENSRTMLEHVRLVMSFASGTFLRNPAIEYYCDDSVEVTLYARQSQSRNSFRLIHYLNLKGIFDAAVESFFDPIIQVKNMNYAIEWLTMDAMYNEDRLIHSMSSLECLIHSNLQNDEKRLINSKQFEKARKILKRFIKKRLARRCRSLINDEIINEMNEKLNDLNRRSLRNNLYFLCNKWCIQIEDLPNELINNAISARNLIVHRGSYYDYAKRDDDLYDKFAIINEVLYRIIFKAIGYEGEYFSLLNGLHNAIFPPPQTATSHSDHAGSS